MAVNGRPRNLPREAAILTKLAEGKSAIQVAKECGCSRNTIYTTVKRAGIGMAAAECLQEVGTIYSQIKEIEEQQARLEQQKLTAQKNIRRTQLRGAVEQLTQLVSKSQEIMRQVGFSGDISDLAALIKALNQEIENG